MEVVRVDGAYARTFFGYNDARYAALGIQYLLPLVRTFCERQESDMEPELGPMARDSSREESANIEKLFWGPTAVKVDDEGRLFVVESCRFRVQVYQRA